MRRLRRKLQGFIESPTFLRKFSKWEAIFWLVASFPIVIFFSENIPVVVWLSVYAILRTSLSNWQSSRMEEKQEQVQDAQADVLEDQTEKIVEEVDKVTPDK